MKNLLESSIFSDHLIFSSNKMEPEVIFNEKNHTYSIDGTIMRRSVTELVGLFFPVFNPVEVATRMLARSDFSTAPKYAQYRIMLSEQAIRGDQARLGEDGELDPRSDEARDLIISSWKKNTDEASSLGTDMHQSIEDYYTLGRSIQTEEFSLFLKFDEYTRRLGYLPFRSEPIVFDQALSLAGSVDMLYIHEDDMQTHPTKVWMVDWKRSKEIKMEGYAKGYPPFRELDDCNYQHYSVQLNLYKYLLEKNHGMSVQRMTLVILHPRQEEYIALEVNNIQHLIVQALKNIPEKKK